MINMEDSNAIEFVSLVNNIDSVENIIYFWSSRVDLPKSIYNTTDLEINGVFLKRLCELLEDDTKEFVLQNWDPMIYVISSAKQLENSLYKIYSNYNFKSKLWTLLTMMRYPGFPKYTLEDNLLRLIVNIGHNIILQMEDKYVNQFVLELFKFVHDTKQEYSSTRAYAITILGQLLKSPKMQYKFSAQVRLILSEVINVNRARTFFELKRESLNTENNCANVQLMSDIVGSWNLKVVSKTFTKVGIFNFLFPFASSTSVIKIKKKRELVDYIMKCITMYNDSKFPTAEFTQLTYSSICVLAECLQDEYISNKFIRAGGLQLLCSLRRPGLCNASAICCIKNITFHDSNLITISMLSSGLIQKLYEYLVWNIVSSYNSSKICSLIAIRCCLHNQNLLEHFDNVNGISYLFNALSTRYHFCDFMEYVRGEKSQKYYINIPNKHLVGPSKVYRSTVGIDLEICKHALYAIRDYLVCHLKFKTASSNFYGLETPSDIKTKFVISLPNLLDWYESHDLFLNDFVQGNCDFEWNPVNSIINIECIPVIIKALSVVRQTDDLHGRLDLITTILDIISVVSLVPSVRLFFFEKKSYVPFLAPCSGISLLLQYFNGYGLYHGLWKFCTLRILKTFLTDIESEDKIAANNICEFIDENNILFQLTELLSSREPSTMTNCIRYAALNCILTIGRIQRIKDICRNLTCLQQTSLHSMLSVNLQENDKHFHSLLQKTIAALLQLFASPNSDNKQTKNEESKIICTNRNNIIKIQMKNELETVSENRSLENIKFLYSNYTQHRVLDSGKLGNMTKFTSVTFGNETNQCYVAIRKRCRAEGRLTSENILYALDLTDCTLTHGGIWFDSDPTRLSLHNNGLALLAIGRYGKKCSLWDLISKSKINIGFGHDEYAEFSPLNDQIIGTDRKSARVYDIASMKMIFDFTPSVSNSYTRNRSTFSPDQRTILHNGILFDINSSRTVCKFPKVQSRLNGRFNIAREYEILQGQYVWDIRSHKIIDKVDRLEDSDIEFGKKTNKIFAFQNSTSYDQNDVIDIYQNQHKFPRIATLQIINGYLQDLTLASDEMTIVTIENFHTGYHSNTFLQVYNIGKASQSHFLQDHRLDFNSWVTYNTYNFGTLELQNDTNQDNIGNFIEEESTESDDDSEYSLQYDEASE